MSGDQSRSPRRNYSWLQCDPLVAASGELAPAGGGHPPVAPRPRPAHSMQARPSSSSSQHMPRVVAPPPRPPSWETWEPETLVYHGPAPEGTPLQLSVAWTDARNATVGLDSLLMQGHCVQAVFSADGIGPAPAGSLSCGSGRLRLYSRSNMVDEFQLGFEGYLSDEVCSASVLNCTVALALPLKRDPPRDDIYSLLICAFAISNERPGSPLAARSRTKMMEYIVGRIAAHGPYPRLIIGDCAGVEEEFAALLEAKLQIPVVWAGGAEYGSLWLTGPVHSISGSAARVTSGVNPEHLNAFPGIRLRQLQWHGNTSIMAYIGRKSVGHGATRIWNQSQRWKSRTPAPAGRHQV